MLDADTLREPQRHRPHAEVPAPVPRPWPTQPVSLRASQPSEKPLSPAGKAVGSPKVSSR